jgi:hypothetical protein
MVAAARNGTQKEARHGLQYRKRYDNDDRLRSSEQLIHQAHSGGQPPQAVGPPAQGNDSGPRWMAPAWSRHPVVLADCGRLGAPGGGFRSPGVPRLQPPAARPARIVPPPAAQWGSEAATPYNSCLDTRGPGAQRLVASPAASAISLLPVEGGRQELGRVLAAVAAAVMPVAHTDRGARSGRPAG